MMFAHTRVHISGSVCQNFKEHLSLFSTIDIAKLDIKNESIPQS